MFSFPIAAEGECSFSLPLMLLMLFPAFYDYSNTVHFPSKGINIFVAVV